MADDGKTFKTPSKKPLCFVIGPIGKDGSAERKHSDLLLNAVIKQVLQTDEFNYAVKRADEDADPGMIGDRVVSDIINADLVVADLTDLNPNAFYELGIRHSTENPTIHVAKTGTQLPFDNIAHRTIFVDLMDWHSIEQARARLADSTRATKAADYRVTNPITQANASFKMRQSEDPKDQLMVEIGERLTSLEGAMRAPERPLMRDPHSERYDDFTELMDYLQIIALPLRRANIDDRTMEDILRQAAKAKGFELTKVAVNSKENIINISTADGEGAFMIDIDEAPRHRRRK
jgi:hypothetical protein